MGWRRVFGAGHAGSCFWCGVLSAKSVDIWAAKLLSTKTLLCINWANSSHSSHEES